MEPMQEGQEERLLRIRVEAGAAADRLTLVWAEQEEPEEPMQWEGLDWPRPLLSMAVVVEAQGEMTWLMQTVSMVAPGAQGSLSWSGKTRQ